MMTDSGKGRYASPEGSAVWEYVATMSCTFVLFNVGCIGGWSAPALGILRGPDAPVSLSSSDTSTLTSMMAVGHTLSPALIMVMASKLGRKNCLMAIAIPALINWGLIAVAESVAVLFVARFCGGLSMGLAYCFPPMYLGEIASPKLRGTIGLIGGVMVSAGILWMFVVVPYFPIHTSAYVCFGSMLVSMASVWFIPESPYFLAMVGRIDEAEGALEKLRGRSDVADELELIKASVGRKSDGKKGQREGEGQEAPGKVSAVEQLFAVVANRRALCINFLFTTVLQLGSFISIATYGHIMFEKMRTRIPAHLCTMIVGTLLLLCNILTACIVDKFGRRPLIRVSGIVSGACVLVVGVYFYLLEYAGIDVTPYGTFAACAMFTNVVAVSVGLMPLQMVVQSEILAPEIKELATSLIGVGGGVLAVIGIKSYLMVAETWGLGHCVPFFWFTATTWISTALILRMLPETKGKTLLAIQKDLTARRYPSRLEHPEATSRRSHRDQRNDLNLATRTIEEPKDSPLQDRAVTRDNYSAETRQDLEPDERGDFE